MREPFDWILGEARPRGGAGCVALRRFAQDDGAARRAALAQLVADWRGRAGEAAPAIGATGFGAPCALGLADPPFVSLAHRPGLLALAVAERPVGVDCEWLGPAQPPAWNVLAETERARLAAIDEPVARHRAFLIVWTQKEAYVKALGLGFRREPSGYAVRDVASGRFVVDDPLGPGGDGETRALELDGRPLLASVATLA